MHARGAIGKEQMDEIVKATGSSVLVNYVDSGTPAIISGMLKSVTPFRNIQVGDDNIPFVGYGIAIRFISVSGKTIYSNIEIPTDYEAKNIRAIMYFAKKSFTKEGMATRRVTIPKMLRT